MSTGKLQDRTAPKPRRPARFRVHILRLVLATALPLVALSAGLAVWTAQEQRGDMLRAMADTANALQLAVDRELRVTIAALEVLSTSPDLDRALQQEAAEQALASFHAQASALVARRTAALLNVSLYSVGTARQVLNTLVVPGAVLPAGRPMRFPPRPEAAGQEAPAFMRAVLQGDEPYVSDLYWPALARNWVVAVALPVRREGRTIAVLAANLRPEGIARILQDQSPPPGWIASVVDRSGIVVARSLEQEVWLAQPATPEIRAFLQAGQGRGGLVRTHSYDKVPVYAAVRRTGTMPWMVVYAAPRLQVDGPLWRALGLASVGGLCAALLAALAALWLGRILGREIEGLGIDAAAVALAEAPPPARASATVREVAMARASLIRAGEALRLRARAKREAEANQALLVREVDHRAKNALAVALSLVRLAPRDVPPERFATSVEGRVAAMARAHALLASHAWLGAELRAVAEGELAAHQGAVRIDGPPARIAAIAVQPLSMLLHEMSANAVRHGALSHPEGRLSLSWAFTGQDGGLRLLWEESGVPQADTAPPDLPPPRPGFGLRLVRQLAERQLGGLLRLVWGEDGLRASLTLPARHVSAPDGPAWRTAAPILATPAEAATALLPLIDDPSSPPSVLVVEDESMLALEAAVLLQEMGCTPVGPAHTLQEALALAAGTPRLSAALLDVNLAGEVVFPLAEVLRARQVPIIFITGYGSDAELSVHAAAATAVLRKPYARGALAEALRRALRHRPEPGTA
ncbi:HWE histidine kinase domain-containing protein [Teichococcus aestuarii]|uniref:HWE histidine kinase domain-containing protein n=1 Tax=Teichococcus aestuarii TaxID=568898 RepID=UPI00361C9029